MNMKKKVRAALIGFGSMGHFHANCYSQLKNVELVAICGTNRTNFDQDEVEINIGKSGKSNLKLIPKFTSYQDLIKNVDFDMVDICVPGYLHEEYAIRAMGDGYHVLCEKPMARNSKQAEKMIKISQKCCRKLMIGQCLRFMPNFIHFKEIFDSGMYGKLLRLDMRRNSTLPKQSWFRNYSLSGGALLDLHLHDSDYINWLLGKPKAVQTFGIVRDTGGIDDLLTNYIYPDGPCVSAEGSWCRGQWSCSTIGVFEKATVELIGTNIVKIYKVDVDNPEIIKFRKNTNPYANEIGYFADCIVNDCDPICCTPRSTLVSMRIVEAEARSATKRMKVNL